ncbi:hypothetical protein T484DRAFT_1974359 [Baffinella frigidus]|nr:hypothetical protein T484DRAFT_1974359 [Cryptophyta sp. CCMP2293]
MFSPPVQRRAHLSRGGPNCPEAGPSIPRRAYRTPFPRRAYPSRGGPTHPEAGLSIPRRAYPSRGGSIRPKAGLQGYLARKKPPPPRTLQ